MRESVLLKILGIYCAIGVVCARGEAVRLAQTSPPEAVAPLESVETPEGWESENPSDFSGRLGLFLGVTGLKDSGSVALGLMGELTYKNLLQFELFGFHDIAQSFENPGATPTDSQQAIFGHFSLGYPIEILSWVIRPRAGIGYGAREGNGVDFNGATALVGLTGTVDGIFRWSVDYLQGLSGRVSQTQTLSTGQQLRQLSQPQQYQQLGIGMEVYVFQSLAVGAKYINARFDGVGRTQTILQVIKDF